MKFLTFFKNIRAIVFELFLIHANRQILIIRIEASSTWFHTTNLIGTIPDISIMQVVGGTYRG
jgi:hypothetical protein